MDVEHKFRRARVRRGDAGSGGLRSEGDLARDIDGMKDCFKEKGEFQLLISVIIGFDDLSSLPNWVLDDF